MIQVCHSGLWYLVHKRHKRMDWTLFHVRSRVRISPGNWHLVCVPFSVIEVWVAWRIWRLSIWTTCTTWMISSVFTSSPWMRSSPTICWKGCWYPYISFLWEDDAIKTGKRSLRWVYRWNPQWDLKIFTLRFMFLFHFRRIWNPMWVGSRLCSFFVRSSWLSHINHWFGSWPGSYFVATPIFSRRKAPQRSLCIHKER